MPFFNQQRRLARRRDLKRLGPEEIQRECDAIDAACDEAARARAMARSPPAECAICLGAVQESASPTSWALTELLLASFRCNDRSYVAVPLLR